MRHIVTMGYSLGGCDQKIWSVSTKTIVCQEGTVNGLLNKFCMNTAHLWACNVMNKSAQKPLSPHDDTYAHYWPPSPPWKPEIRGLLWLRHHSFWETSEMTTEGGKKEWAETVNGKKELSID